MSKIKGKNSITAMNISGTFYPVFCAKSFVLNISQEEIEVTNVGSVTDREFLPGLGDATVTVDGLMEIDNSDGRVSILYLIQQGIRRKVQQLRTSFTDDDGNVQVLTYNAFYRSGSLSKLTGAYNTNSVEFRVTGNIAFSGSIDPPVDPICEVQTPLVYTLLEGETTVTAAELTTADAEALWVTREGIGYTIVTGTPVGRQCSVDYGTGEITFPAPANEGGEGIEIDWQIAP